MQFIILYDVWIYLDLPTKEFILTLRFLYVPPSLIFKKNLCGARLALSVLYGSQNWQRLLFCTTLNDWFL